MFPPVRVMMSLYYLTNGTAIPTSTNPSTSSQSTPEYTPRVPAAQELTPREAHGSAREGVEQRGGLVGVVDLDDLGHSTLVMVHWAFGLRG